MTVVVDTCVLIDHLRGDARAQAVVGARLEAGQRVVGSVLTRTEILHNVRPAEESATADLLASLDWLPVDRMIADLAGRYAQRFGRSHRGIDLVDFVIAASTTLEDATLLTRNVKHFPMFADLTSPY